MQNIINNLTQWVQSQPLETWVIVGVILLAQGFVLSGALEYLKRKYDWKERGDFYIHRVILLISFIVALGEQGLSWLNASGLATTTFGTYAAAIFMYFIGVKKLGVLTSNFYNYLVDIGNKAQPATVPQGRDISNEEIWGEQS